MVSPCFKPYSSLCCGIHLTPVKPQHTQYGPIVDVRFNIFLSRNNCVPHQSVLWWYLRPTGLKTADHMVNRSPLNLHIRPLHLRDGVRGEPPRTADGNCGFAQTEWTVDAIKYCVFSNNVCSVFTYSTRVLDHSSASMMTMVVNSSLRFLFLWGEF